MPPLHLQRVAQTSFTPPADGMSPELQLLEVKPRELHAAIAHQGFMTVNLLS